MQHVETLEGHVVDLACLRKYSQDELAKRGREHTTACALMGHCMESGYGLVNERGQVALLDTGATPEVVKSLRGSRRKSGIRLRATREQGEHGMRTVHVEEI